MATSEIWASPPDDLALQTDVVHVWAVQLAQPQSRIAELFALLSAAERARAAAFRFDAQRQHYIVAHAALRLLLARYTASLPEYLIFETDAWGKPELAQYGTPRPLRFNLTHSQSLALCAITQSRRIGVDVEWQRPLDDLDAVAKRFFSPHEIETLFALPAEQKLLGFYHAWTRKESYIKAIGKGLSQPLAQFSVSLAPQHPPQLLAVEGDPAAPQRWSFASFYPAPNYVGALAVEGPIRALQFWSFDV